MERKGKTAVMPSEARGIVISINSSKKRKMEEWLRKEMVERYGDAHCMNNPLVRICVMFDSLSDEAQHELFGYAKGRILEFGQNLKLRDMFWAVLDKGGEDGSWEDVEEFASQMVYKEHISGSPIRSEKGGEKGASRPEKGLQAQRKGPYKGGFFERSCNPPIRKNID